MRMISYTFQKTITVTLIGDCTDLNFLVSCNWDASIELMHVQIQVDSSEPRTYQL
jgi:hypothetical protein